MKISVIMPVYNEEKLIEKSLTSLTNQTLKPTQILVIDDCSTNGTSAILSKFQDSHGNIKILKVNKHDANSTFVRRIPFVLQLASRFLDENFDFVGIFDADTILEPQYYQKLVNVLLEDEEIGCAGGKLLGQPDVGLILGMIPYVYGCNRLYTRKCWMELNDGKIMKPFLGWDTYHNLYARMLGYHPKRCQDITSWCMRPSGVSTGVYAGFASYLLGYYGWYVMLRVLRNLSPKMLVGYLKGMFSGTAQYKVKVITRQVQMRRIKRLLKLSK